MGSAREAAAKGVKALLEAADLLRRGEALTALMRIDAADGGDDAAPSMQ